MIELDNLDGRILRAMEEMGFENLTPIQEQAIPALLTGKDVIGQAQTGTGKTAAFGIPLLQGIDPNSRALQAIVLCPTRELAVQAANQLRDLAKFMHGIKILPIYGGQDISKQINNLRGVQLIVGTPGRVMDHMRRHTIKLEAVRMVVLDEADEMLNMGFREDMETILGQIPGAHQTALFSATMPKPILEITKNFQENAVLVKVAAEELTIPLVKQRFFRVRHEDRDAATMRLLEYYQPSRCLIFCNTKTKVDELSDALKAAGYQAEGLHGDLSQYIRDSVMRHFRTGSTAILIATDVAARGIDVDDVEFVINYDLPQDTEYYVHRIGRTGRAGKTGMSFSFVSARESYRIREIERICHTKIEEKKLPGTSKVIKERARRYMHTAWTSHREDADLEKLKSFLQSKVDTEEDCDLLTLAACMLKMQVGEKGEEIAVDMPVPKKKRDEGRRDDKQRGGRERRFREDDGRGRERRHRDDEGRGGERSCQGEEGRRKDRRYRDEEGRSSRNRDDRRRDKDRSERGGRALSKGDSEKFSKEKLPKDVSYDGAPRKKSRSEKFFSKLRKES